MLLEYYLGMFYSIISIIYFHVPENLYCIFLKKKLSQVIFPISQEYWEISPNTVLSWDMIWGYKLFELMMMMMMMMMKTWFGLKMGNVQQMTIFKWKMRIGHWN